MTVPAVSVIVASRHRPELLMRALTALAQQDHDRIEVIVVADPDAAERVRSRGLAVKLVEFDQANVARARNAGLVVAAAEIVAFLDDDAVPEPTWASRLVTPFADGRVMQAGGYVLGRNGISVQWGALEVDSEGRDHPLDLPETVSLHAGSSARAIKTQGTNCAFRRDALTAIGGFDPAFRFYLDDADVNLRLAARGGLTAVVPQALVHHGFAASARRRADRTPLCLHEIGASTAYFLRRHAPDRMGDALEDLRRVQRRRLLTALQDGRLEPRDVPRLQQTLEYGIAEGQLRPLADPPRLSAGGSAFLPLPGTGPRPGRVILGLPSISRRLAVDAVARGAVVTVLGLGLWPRRHRMRFVPDGYWWQTGGIFALSDRQRRRMHWQGRSVRAAGEVQRLRSVRPISAPNVANCLSAVQHAFGASISGDRNRNVR